MVKKLLENWTLKVLALIFAAILWFFVTGEQRLERSYAVPLDLKNLPNGMMVASELPETIDVRISGPRTLLMNLHLQQIRIAIDLQGLEPGLTTLKRLEERLDLPGPLKITRLSPSYVDVKLERIASKQVEVAPRISGEPAAGYRLAEVRSEPRRVMVEGAESEVAKLERIATATLDVTGLRENLRRDVQLLPAGAFTSIKNLETVTLEVVIVPLSQEE